MIALAQQQDYNQVVIRNPDGDIFHTLLHYAHQLGIEVMFDTGTGDNRRILNVTELAGKLGAKYCDCILVLYVFYGSRHKLRIERQGKDSPIKKVQNAPRFQHALCR